MKRHNLQPPFRESSDSLRQQAASTNLPMPSTPASGNGVYALALVAIEPAGLLVDHSVAPCRTPDDLTVVPVSQYCCNRCQFIRGLSCLPRITDSGTLGDALDGSSLTYIIGEDRDARVAVGGPPTIHCCSLMRHRLQVTGCGPSSAARSEGLRNG